MQLNSSVVLHGRAATAVGYTLEYLSPGVFNTSTYLFIRIIMYFGPDWTDLSGRYIIIGRVGVIFPPISLHPYNWLSLVYALIPRLSSAFSYSWAPDTNVRYLEVVLLNLLMYYVLL